MGRENIIMDEQIIKYITINYMTTDIKLHYYNEYRLRLNRVNRVYRAYDQFDEIENKLYKPLDRLKYPSIYKYNALSTLKDHTEYKPNNIFTYDEFQYYKRWYNEYETDRMQGWRKTRSEPILFNKLCLDSEIFDYIDIVPWSQYAVMINISPNWKGNINKTKIKLIENFYEAMGQLPRYKNLAYVVECGAEGNFVHGHGVLEFDTAYSHKKKIIQHMKSNINKEIKKIWDIEADKLCKRYKDMVLDKGPSINRSIITNNDVFRDKLAYLIEDNKPQDHKNKKHELFPVYKSTWA